MPPSCFEHEEERQEFLKNARTAARLSARNLVELRAVRIMGEFIVFVMEYVEGETLAQKVRREGPLRVAAATRIVHDVAYGVGIAGEYGLVHGNLTPDNIMIEARTGRALVMDLGLVPRFRQRELITLRERHASVPFVSPEVRAGRLPTSRSDGFSLGVIGYFAVTGAVPLDQNETIRRATGREVHELLPPIRVHGRGMDSTFQVVIESCLNKDPAKRYRHARELRYALSHAADLDFTEKERVKMLRPSRLGWSGPELWLRFFASPLGEWFVWLAGLGLKRPPPDPPEIAKLKELSYEGVHWDAARDVSNLVPAFDYIVLTRLIRIRNYAEWARAVESRLPPDLAAEVSSAIDRSNRGLERCHRRIHKLLKGDDPKPFTRALLEAGSIFEPMDGVLDFVQRVLNEAGGDGGTRE
ncbi:MAG: serine/threonine protein kinase [Gemmatimonadetes bacterium]|nr:serine/threonine protein kinase [Gemmatimonadota bacterium]